MQTASAEYRQEYFAGGSCSDKRLELPLDWLCVHKAIGMPSKQWLLREWLKRARDTLLSANGRVPIIALSFELGFPAPSKFATYYKREFGETPRETLRRCRKDVGKVA